MESNKAIGRRIREHRINLKMSPERFGDSIGVSGMTVRRIEAGEGLHLRTAGAIADSMDKQVTDIWRTPTSSKRKPAAPRRTMVAA